MRRGEAAGAVLFAAGMVATGATWLLGAYGLLVVGILVLALVLFVVDVEG